MKVILSPDSDRVKHRAGRRKNSVVDGHYNAYHKPNGFFAIRPGDDQTLSETCCRMIRDAVIDRLDKIDELRGPVI
jgi:hypothetical protein